MFPDVATAVSAMVSSHTVEPDAGRAGAFDERYARWREVYATMRTWSV
jgi:sugar (pentulose or hexulose) kinase